MNAREDQLATQVERVLRSVPGLTGLYRAGQGLSGLVAEGARRLRGAEAPSSFVRVIADSEGLRVEASIGVGARHRAPEVVREAEKAVRASLDAAGEAASSIVLTVVRIDEA